MHAVVVEVSINDADDARQELSNRVIPMIRQAPGFVSGVWYVAGEDKGRSVVVFETEEGANAAADMIRGNARAAVTMDDVSVREVVATA